MTTPAYLTGFANQHATEAVAGALPVGRNSPQRVPLGLYAEQSSGTAFTAPRSRTDVPGPIACAPPPTRSTPLASTIPTRRSSPS